MKQIFKLSVAVLGVGVLTFSHVTQATAKTPPEVLTPYKAYNAALKAKDYDLAGKKAYEAWMSAEKLMGDDNTTGALADNYTTMARRLELKKDVKKAFERAIELAPLAGEKAVDTRLHREVAFGEWQLRNSRNGMNKRLRKAAEFAKENGYENSTFLGEIYTMLAQLNIEDRRHKTVENYAEMALEIFENRTDGIESYHPYLARLYSGYGKEGQEDLVPAVMEYQHVMQNVEGKLPKNHPFVSRALGRWLNMRHRIVREGKLDEAQEAGMCECWPYDKKRNEAIQPIKRVPPVMPRKAWQSGFSLVEFDVDDAGNVINPRLLESWPEEVFDKSSIKAVKQWKYTPRTEAEVDSDRTDIVTTIRYILTGPGGRVIE
jgi:TonB family protein